jgi:hypothetical protein
LFTTGRVTVVRLDVRIDAAHASLETRRVGHGLQGVLIRRSSGKI